MKNQNEAPSLESNESPFSYQTGDTAGPALPVHQRRPLNGELRGASRRISYRQRARGLIRTTWGAVFLLALMLMAGRYAMFRSFVDPAQSIRHGDAVWRMWRVGVLFDLRVAITTMLPVLLPGLLLSATAAGWRWLRRLAIGYGALAAFLFTFIASANYYYYQTYHSFIDIFAFGLLDDDQTAIFKIIWQDYPVIGIFCAALVYSGATGLLIRWGLQRIPQRTVSVIGFLAVLLASGILFTIFGRGSIGTFPLRRTDSQVSSYTVLNMLTPNGVAALEWAVGDYFADLKLQPVDLAEGPKLLRDAGLDAVHARTPGNASLARHPPHVVVALMESMGSNMLAFDHMPDTDLLGSLRSGFSSDFVFRHFVSEGNGTAPSLMALLFQSPQPRITLSRLGNKRLTDTPVAVYKKAGYKTVFVTSGSAMWRRVGDYLKAQGVDEIYDQESLMKAYPESAAQLEVWGIPDEYTFRFAETLLKQSDQPIFLVILTATNHPPYKAPPAYRPGPLAISPRLREHAGLPDTELHALMETYQYAANELGKFIQNIKDAPSLATNVLIAATGDHQMRRLDTADPAQQFETLAVPFYLYIPAAILARSEWKFDPDRPGSHKDILPTLYAYSLSDTGYLALGGRNLLSPHDDPSRAFGYNVRLGIDALGAYPLQGPVDLYPWNKADSMLVQTQARPDANGRRKKTEAYVSFLKWRFNAALQGVGNTIP